MTAEVRSAVPTGELPPSAADGAAAGRSRSGTQHGATRADRQPGGTDGTVTPAPDSAVPDRAAANGDSPAAHDDAGAPTAASTEPASGTRPDVAGPEAGDRVDAGSAAGPADASWANRPVDAAGGPEDTVAGEVAERLRAAAGDDPSHDPHHDPAGFAAAAVLDVLRAAGWADAAEAAELRGEAERLRELLNLVIRDHRAREASAAGMGNQQLQWLIPLLRAAHGVAFGSLGAKVALRTAVQDVPPDMLAKAGLRIDYGVEPYDPDGDEPAGD